MVLQKESVNVVSTMKETEGTFKSVYLNCQSRGIWVPQGYRVKES